MKNWFYYARPHALGQSVLPTIVAIIFAACYGSGIGFNWLIAAAVFFGVLFAHLGVNLLDDYFDYKLNKDKIKENIDAGGKYARFGKCLYLFDGSATPKSLLIAAVCFLAAAVFAGGLVALKAGIVPILIAAVAGVLCFFYSAPPLKLSYRGLGETIVGIVFGPLLMNGVFYSLTGAFDMQLFIVSVAVGALAANILYVHSVLDCESDLAVGKKTLASTYFKKHKEGGVEAFVLIALMVVLVNIGEYFSKWFLLILLILPWYFALVVSVKKYLTDTDKNDVKRWWYGSMEDWERIKTYKIEWFMVRWYLARNITVLFCFAVIAAKLLECYA